MSTLEGAYHVTYMLHLGHREVIGMGKKFRVDKKKVDRLETLEYSEMIKLAAVYKILEDEGVTPEIIEKWGYYYKGKQCLKIPVSRTKEGVDGSDFLFNTRVYEVIIDLS